MIDLVSAEELDQLAARIARIRPMSNTNPDAFYEERSEVASQIRAMATRLRCPVAAAEPARAPAPIGRQAVSHSVRHIEGRTVVVLNRRAAAPAIDHPFY